MRTGIASQVAAGDVGANGGPELAGRRVAADGVPGQSGVIPAQRGQSGAGQAVPLVVRIGLGPLDPAQPAAATDLVVDAEDLFVAEIRRALPPGAPALDGEGVLPRSIQVRYMAPVAIPAEPAAADPPQERPAARAVVPDPVGLRDQLPGVGRILG